jgi:hypothetical protein
LPDGYTEVTIEAVAPGAELEGIVYDQWVTISRRNVRLGLFDMSCICPESLVGTKQRVKIGLMPTRIAPSQKEATSITGNTFIAKVVPNIGDEEKLVEVFGVTMQLLTDREQEPGSVLEIRGRLDLLEIRGVDHEGWRNATSNP